ncbi:adenosine receptor A3-like [Oculina patagonica]
MTNTSYNSPEYTMFKGVSWMVVYICEAVLILIGNSITVYIFWSIRKRLKRTSYILINLAIADILVGIAITLFIVARIGVYLEWDVNDNFVVIKTASSIDLIGTTSSVLSLALISLERMLAILWPFRHRLLNIWCYHVSVGFIWFVSALNVFINVELDPHTTTTENAYNILTPITFVCSVIIITGAYLAIWISTRGNQVDGKNTRRQMEQSRKLAKTLLLVTTLSIITCVPYAIGIAFTDFLKDMYTFQVQITFAAQYANSFLNPVVYCFKMPEFKESLRKLSCRCALRCPLFNKSASETSSGITLRSFKDR